MTDEKKPLVVTFAPGCFEHFDGTQEELDELIKTIQEMAENGTLAEQSVPLDEALDLMSDEDLQELADQLGVDFEDAVAIPLSENKKLH